METKIKMWTQSVWANTYKSDVPRLEEEIQKFLTEEGIKPSDVIALLQTHGAVGHYGADVIVTLLYGKNKGEGGGGN